MRNEMLPFNKPEIGQEEIDEVIDTLRSGWITKGPKTRIFEGEFAEFLGAPGAVALNSCTAGLHTALVALGVGPGDEVITTPMTFTASANVIEHTGANTVLADVEEDTLNISPAQIESVITERTKAIIAVHYSGHPVDLDPIQELADKHGIAVIEDAAHAIPAKYKGRLIGSGKNATAFSFYATKNLTTGDGGMLTGSEEFLERARSISHQGMDHDAWKRYGKGGNWFYEVILPGYKYNMTDIQAALGLWQLRKLQKYQQRRHEIVSAYTRELSGEEALILPSERDEVEHAWHLYILRLNPELLTIDRAQFIEELKGRNISTSVHYIPIHMHPYYKEKYRSHPNDYPVAHDNYQNMLTLPLHPGLTDGDIGDVVEAVLDVVGTFRR